MREQHFQNDDRDGDSLMATSLSHICTELVWPEPWVIELIVEHLDAHPLTSGSRRALARRHAAALRDMIADRDSSWRSARLAVVEAYASLGIARACMSAIDRAVFFELTHLATHRHRNSPRRRREAGGMLQAAIDRLPSSSAAPVRTLAA